MDELGRPSKPEADVATYPTGRTSPDQSLQDQKHSAMAHQGESADSEELLQERERSKEDPGRPPQHARSIMSRSTITRALIDFAMLLVPIYFLAFGLLVYSTRMKPADHVLGGQLARRLSEIAKINSTLFPIVFAAIAGNFIKALAAFRLEKGTSVFQLDHLLNSRSPFSTLATSYGLKTVNLTTLLLVVLWLLSPLGGQASSRVLEIGPLYSNRTNNFTYLSFMSGFTNEGVGSASTEILGPINALFAATLSSSFSSMMSPQDLYGNVKIPYYEYLDAPGNSDSPWRNVPNDSHVPWSSLTGLPILGLGSNGTSRFTLSTGYMLPDCKVTVSNISAPSFTFYSLESWRYWSGANFAVNVSVSDSNFTFSSLSYGNGPGSVTAVLTVANCTTKMSYVMVQVECSESTCRSVAVRPSTSPASHDNGIHPLCRGSLCTPLDAVAQTDTMHMAFWKNLVNSTNPHAACDTAICPTSIIEGYLANPQSPLMTSATSPISISDRLMSQRMGQIINTYWINSIAPFAGSGNFTVPANATVHSDIYLRYNVDSSVGSVESSVTVIICDTAWFVALRLISTVLLLVGIAAGVLNLRLRGPNILDSFSALVRDSVYCVPELPRGSSMEDGLEQSRRLRDTIVRLGDVRVGDDVGHVAVGVVSDTSCVGRLRPNREYN